VVVGTLTTVLMVALGGTAARADPISEIERKINTIWSEAEPLIEKYNQTRAKQEKTEAKRDALLKEIEPLQRQIDLSRLRVGTIAAQIYRGGNLGPFAAILSNGSPDMLADQLTYLEHVSLEQQRQISGVTDLIRRYDVKRAPIDALLRELESQTKDLNKKRKVIQDKLDELEKLRLQAYGTTNGTGSYRPWPCPAPDEYLPTKGWKAGQFACKQAGDSYDMGAAGPNVWDCSGLTMVSWQQAGVYLPHSAADQKGSITSVKRTDLRVGDLVFYYGDIHHVAIYVGDGKVMHAPTWGDRVRMRVLEDVGPVYGYGRPG
jgi:hypothetical protein